MEHIHLPHDHGTGTEQLLENMPEFANFEKTAHTFNLLSDAARVKILWLLCHTEDCVTNIAATMEMSSPAVSHHLRILKQAGILTSSKHGKEVWYRLSNTREAQLVHHIVDIIFDLNCKGRY